MALARFLQVSDLHLGRPFSWLPAARRDERRRDQQRALETAVAQAIERGVHAILIPGDLFDDVTVEAGLLTFALRAFEVNGCPPVFIAPGNHDPVSASNPAWDPRLLRARGARWPSHVHVFDSPNWSAVTLPKPAGVRIWGRCFTASGESVERPLTPEALRAVAGGDPVGFDLALFHGSREGRCPPGQKITAPFSDEEVAASPFVYLAVGHYHAASRLEAAHAEGTRSAGARLAYAGSAISLDLTETGSHGALEVRIEFGHRLPFVEVEPIELDRRRVLDLAVDVMGAASPDQLERRVLRALDSAGATDQDMATVRLSGRLGAGVHWAGPGAAARARLFCLRVDASAVRSDYDLDAYRTAEPRTTEERFARELLARLDAETDPQTRATIELALRYGLDAFRLREVVPAPDEVTS
ncbi:MAG TPA: metallophosphoesterase [Candidatus Acidoferrales bacterium]|nr:metallophosphoesterase [Candidatus Acidoferrales bacterium]